MNLLDLFDENAEADRAYHREYARNQLSGPCEDDASVICPFIGMCPDESDHEGGSPLSFKESEIDRLIQEALRYPIG